jgi:hypothetical protein
MQFLSEQRMFVWFSSNKTGYICFLIDRDCGSALRGNCLLKELQNLISFGLAIDVH